MTQPGVLAPLPAAGHFLELDLAPGGAPRVLAWLEGLAVDEGLVVALGRPLVDALGAEVPGLRQFPALEATVAIPSTTAALWLWARADTPGEALDRATAARRALGDSVVVRRDVAAFQYQGGRDLTGYEDGTENPVDGAAVEAAVARGVGPGLDGGCFVAAQQWQHDWARIRSLSGAAMNHVFGRDRVSNDELDEAPASAHVKRAAQEDFEPPAFQLRRSMPWGGVEASGLMFVSFGADLDRFEAVLRRMAGLDDGVVDGLFSVSRPLSGTYGWCPPVRGGALDLSALRR
jgi:putative iron-dependent peroxidase